MKLRNKIAAALAAAYIGLAGISPAKAANVTTGYVSGPDSGTLDTKANGTISGNLGYFFRNRSTVDYRTDNQVSSATLFDLTYPIGKGLDFVVECKFPSGMAPDPRSGMQYSKAFSKGADSMMVYALVTRDFNAAPYTELVTLLGYSRDINGKLKLSANWEEIIDIGDRNNNFDTSRLRLGIGNDRVTIGPALDITGIGSGERPVYAAGGFININIK